MSKLPTGRDLDDLKYATYEEWKQHGDGTYQVNGHQVKIEDDDCTGLASNPKVTEIDGKRIR